MLTVGIRELKQNPAEVIARVLATGLDAEIIAYGKPTAVRLVADEAVPKKWVNGATVNDLPGLEADDETLKDDISSVFVDDDYVTDPWAGRE
ncbi:MAG: hypothetical protein ACTH1Z_11370 [Ancrocorticia sp.]|uniref:hypothetical protein n=1 Tax=Ancrocorticia sp. TaxID=2593684 RepID=UPI003F8E58B6